MPYERLPHSHRTADQDMSHYEWKDNTLHLHLRVVPRSSKVSISGLLDDRLKVTITAPPVDGKGNAHLIRWLAKLCDVPKSSVAVVAGETSRNKTVAISRPTRIPDNFLVTEKHGASDWE